MMIERCEIFTKKIYALNLSTIHDLSMPHLGRLAVQWGSPYPGSVSPSAWHVCRGNGSWDRRGQRSILWSQNTLRWNWVIEFPNGAWREKNYYSKPANTPAQCLAAFPISKIPDWIRQVSMVGQFLADHLETGLHARQSGCWEENEYSQVKFFQGNKYRNTYLTLR